MGGARGRVHSLPLSLFPLSRPAQRASLSPTTDPPSSRPPSHAHSPSIRPASPHRVRRLLDPAVLPAGRPARAVRPVRPRLARAGGAGRRRVGRPAPLPRRQCRPWTPAAAAAPTIPAAPPGHGPAGLLLARLPRRARLPARRAPRPVRRVRVRLRRGGRERGRALGVFGLSHNPSPRARRRVRAVRGLPHRHAHGGWGWWRCFWGEA